MKTKLIVLTIILIFASLYATDTLCSYTGDKTDRLSAEQSSIFSPGYINASMQKTRDIVNQANHYKSPIENTTENLKDKLSGDVMEDSANKITPELKKKTGPAAETVKEDIPSVFVIETSELDGSAADKTLDVIAANQGVLKGTVSFEKLSNGNMAFTWVKDNKLYGQIYDEGAIAQGDVFSISAISGAANLIRALSNGKFVVAYNNSASESSFKILNSDGSTYKNEFSAPPLLSMEKTTFPIVTLSDGGFAVSWGGFEGGNMTSFLRIYNNDGSIGNTVSLKASSGSNQNYNATITALANGNIAAAWLGGTKSYLAIFDSKGIQIKPTQLVSSKLYKSITGLSNGNFVLAGGTNGGSIYFKIFNSDGTEIASAEQRGAGSISNQAKVTELSDGKLLFTSAQGKGYFAMIYDQNGNALGERFKVGDVNYTGGSGLGYYDYRVNTFSDGTFSVSWLDRDKGYTYNRYSTLGKEVTQSLINGGFSIDSNKISESLDLKYSVADAILSKFSYYNYGAEIGDLYDKKIEGSTVASIFKGLLANKGSFQGEAQNEADLNALSKVVKDVLDRSALSISQNGVNFQEMDLAIRLANIIKNPTEDQKMMLDAVTALLNEIGKLEQGSDSPELKKATDDLLQMVASILIAQTIPDLLKEGDMSNAKSIFSELNAENSRIMLEYQDSIKPYYDETVKMLVKNIGMLQLKNIISNNLTKEELENIPRNELDKILEKLRQAKERSFEEEYMLQQEAKYRKQYIDPNKKLLEDKMKDMMKDFTGKLSKVLENTKK